MLLSLFTGTSGSSSAPQSPFYFGSAAAVTALAEGDTSPTADDASPTEPVSAVHSSYVKAIKAKTATKSAGAVPESPLPDVKPAAGPAKTKAVKKAVVVTDEVPAAASVGTTTVKKTVVKKVSVSSTACHTVHISALESAFLFV